MNKKGLFGQPVSLAAGFVVLVIVLIVGVMLVSDFGDATGGISNSTAIYTKGVLGSSGGLTSWLPMTISLMIGIFVITFVLFKTIRWSLIGAGVSGIGFVVFKFSEYISKQSVAGNGVPLNWYMYAIVFLAVSVLIGQILQHTKWGKKLNAEMDKKAEWLEQDDEVEVKKVIPATEYKTINRVKK